ncbi:AMP-binding protein, partial [Umezawaea sp.]|uniref:AMP-binding protein n=1 Tax=Umezawaea sp. TaxID=1955258 RepID=UPI002ED47D63
AVWAVWKSGGAFLPLDPELPAARLAVMVEDAVPVVVVSREATPESWRTVPLEPDTDVPDVDLPQVGARDLAYVMFTSGSTGRPKGVMVDHGGLANYAETLLLPRMRRAGLAAGSQARVLTGTSAFISDFFLTQILPLLDGHLLLVVSGAEGRDPRHLVELAQDPERSVDVIDVATSQVQVMVEAGLLDTPHPPTLVAFGGEVCPPDLWHAFRSHPDVVGHNMYGPAEVTVDAAFADIGAHESSVIGRPYGNVRVHLVDEHLHQVPPGSPGEIVIGGPGVGRGYVRRPGATAAVFVPDPWGEPGSRLYRTGDLGRYTVDGQIEFLGRNDHQVKIQGQRVEPEEVEAVLRAHPAIDAAAVSAHRVGADGRLRLVAHLVVAGAVLDREEIREHLLGALPAAAVPTVLVRVDALPMTVGGKLDRRALTVPDDVDTRLPHRDVVAPRTGTERRIAAAWRAVLGVADVGVHDDFFALGGHSLLAIRLTMALSRDFAARIPLSHLYTAPTIAEQAERIDDLALRGDAAETRAVVPLGGVRGARPLVLVHPVGGTLFSYLDLLGEVATDFEAFGLQGRIGGEDSGATDLAGLAERYADELVPVLGDREPVVAGWSAGGVIAHALARALADRGIAVHRLVLVDSDPRRTADVEAERLDIATLDALRADVLERGPAPLLGFDGADRLFVTLGVDPSAVAALDGPTVAALMAFWRDVFTGLVDHRPAAFDGPTDLVLASGDGADLVAAAWRDLTGTLSVTHVDGDHFQLMRRPWVKAVADTLRGSTAQTGD